MSLTPHQTAAHKILRKLGVYDRFPGEQLPTYEEFISAVPPVFFKMMQLLTGAVQHINTVAMLEFMYPVFIASKFGDPEFRLSKELIVLLRDTDTPDLLTDFLRLPFPGINLDVPCGTFQKPADKVSRILLAYVPGDRFRVSFDTLDGNTHFINFLFEPGKTISQCIAETRTKEAEMLECFEREIEDYRAQNIYEDYFTADVFRLALNAALYIASGDADVRLDDTKRRELHTRLQGLKGRSKREKLLEQLRREKQRKVYIVGGMTRLSREYATVSQQRRQLLVRFRVRGHFRHQACGPGLTERKLIWVAPFWKGPTYAELVEKGYVVT